MKLYSVIKMDLVSSRTIQNRSEIQEILTKYLNKISKKYIDDLVVPITMSLGDDWVIVLKNCKLSYSIYLEIQQFLKKHHQSAYAGIGIGSLEINNSHDIRNMHGSAFTNANMNLKIAKSNKYGYQKNIPTKACKVYFSGLSDELDSEVDSKTSSEDTMINTLIQNNELLLSKITTIQQEVIELYESYDSYQDIINNHPHMSKRKLSDGLKKSNYWLIRENILAVEQLIESHTTNA